MSGSNCCFLNCIQVSHEAGKLKLLSCVWLFATPWTVAHQAPPSMGFSRQEYWSGLPFPSRWSGISISKNLQQFVVIHTVKGFIVVNEAEVDFFLWNSLAFFNVPMDVGNLISGSSAFSKFRLYNWKFLIHILVKPSLKDFQHNLTNMCSSTYKVVPYFVW